MTRFESGKYYKTQSGHKAYIMGFTPDGLDTAFPMRGFIKTREGKGWIICNWKMDGRTKSYYQYPNQPEPYDLTLNEWEDIGEIELDILFDASRILKEATKAEKKDKILTALKGLVAAIEY